MFKSAIARMVASLLVTVLAVGEAGAKGINPAYKKWMREIGKERQQTGAVPMRRMVKAAAAASDEEKALGTNNGLIILDSVVNYGLRPPLIDYRHIGFVNTHSSRLCASESLPPQFDSRDNGWISSVKNQGGFGTCWAHAALGAIEAKLRKDNDGTYHSLAQPDFSENNVVMQRGDDVHPYLSPDHYDPVTRRPSEYMIGGFFEDAFQYFARWGGPILETDDPYPTEANKFSTHGSNVRKMPSFHLQEYIKYRPKNSSLDHAEIKSAIMKYGSVWVTFCVIQESVRLQDQSGSVFDIPCFSADGKSYYNWTSLVLGERQSSNHAVLLIGWDDKYSKSNFSFKSSPRGYSIEPPGDGAYLIKNSWGERSGDNGYLWVSYYDDNLLYDDSYAIPSVEKTDNYSDVYQHDPLGLVYSFPDSSYKWGANVFTATNNTSIAALGFYSMSQGTSYIIQIYTGVTAENPVSGTCRIDSGKKGVVPYAGFTTVVLDEPITLTKGQRFSVVLSLDSPECDEPFGAEANLTYKTDWWSKYPTIFKERFSYSLTSKATASAGQSFVSKDGANGTWRDITTEIAPICVDEEVCLGTLTDKNGKKTDLYDKVMFDTSTANLCIKAYMQSQSASKGLKEVEIAGADTSIVAGGRIALSCTAHYNNAPAKDVTGDATWSIVQGYGDDVATVVSSGVIETAEVDDSRLVRVQAKYSEDGISKSDTWDFYVTVAPPTPPTDLVATEGEMDAGIRLNWTAPKGATYYSVYRSVASDSSKAKCIASKITDHQYFDNGESLPGETVIPGKDYYYFVKAGNAAGYNKLFSNGAMGWRKLAAPETVTASDGTREDAVELKWSEVSGAKYYHVYRSEEIEGTRTELGSWQTDTQYEDMTAEPGVTYYYYVVAAVDNRGRRPSDYSIIEDGYRPVPVVPQSLEISGESSIPSGGSATYTCDLIYSNNTRDKNVGASWSIESGPATVQGNKVTANVVSSNGKAVLKAAYGGLSVPKTIQITAVKPHAPTSAPVVSVEENGIRVSWEAVADATSYSVFRKTGSVEVYIGTVKEETDYLDNKALPGVTYTYRISAGNNAGNGDDYSPYSDSVCLLLAAPSGVTATTDDPDRVTVSWKEVAGAKSYRVYRAESVSGTKTALGSGWQSGRSYEDATGTAGKTYYYFVQAAASATGSGAGAYSAGAIGKRPQPVTLQSIEICDGATRVASGGRTVFTCKAHYSDGTDTPVVPEWSVSPSGSATIDANGQFVASKVTSDQTVVVGASYGGKTASPVSVRIVAPVAATAKIVNVRTSARWPFSGLIDIDYELQTTPSGTKAFVSVSGYDNDRQMAMAARTISGDGATGTAIAAGAHRLSWDVAADYPKFRSSSLGVDLAAVPVNILPPTGVSATPDTSAGKITLTWPSAENATGYEVWRGTSSSIADAEKIGTVSAASFPDSTVVAGTTYYYWVRSIGEGGGASEFGDPVTAKVNPTTYTIVFNANGGTGSMSSLPMVYGTAKNLPTNAFKPPHEIREFDGWALSPTGPVVYRNQESVNNLTTVNGGSVTLYAVWERRIKYLTRLMSKLSNMKNIPPAGRVTPDKVRACMGNPTLASFDEDYSCVSEFEFAILDEMYVLLADKYEVYEYARDKNYELISDDDLFWLEGIGSAIDDLRYDKVLQSTSFYKVFSIDYSIIFYPNGGRGTDLLSQQTIGMAFGNQPNPRMFKNQFTRTDCEFLGWATSSTGPVVYEDGADLTKISKPSGGTLTLYAVWKAVRVTVSFNANGGSGTMTNETVKTGSSYVIPTSKFKRTDYAFQGWATSSSGGVVYADGATIPSLSADLVLYAIWKSNFVLTGSVNGWTISLSWNNVSGAAKYKVYRRKMGWSVLSTELSDCEYIGETTKTTYTDTLTSVSSAGLRLNYYVGYIVVAVNAQGTTMKYTALRTFAIKTN